MTDGVDPNPVRGKLAPAWATNLGACVAGRVGPQEAVARRSFDADVTHPYRSHQDTVSTPSAATTRSSTLLYARPAFLSIPLGSLGTADFEAPSSDDVDELGRSRGSQMTSHASIIG
ncbi:hypothetical protein EMIHUDRAFT_220921 [Emiliania huxleyi CCMP1516]|uniref:Uncharacterized protein n=2 Tax=Emiliania huxleyi TaxID=2903 RepID=A0A0D3HZP7_EMIH1|nr:hypothetical protein EMIHUDRAFT_220921 [Emiliania huxleyi CCMP1516]EOD04482.1 hypothetical protein EMIHUDRAFT_220921 [Emiliania huxleyi CCMP1516]|eukprot:XP_005756911.1 hypothetical protein EMIHUDRAFT_220921 [Emiliania huxleyi CCMP1516]